jgi:hypothetical protein
MRARFVALLKRPWVLLSLAALAAFFVGVGLIMTCVGVSTFLQVYL